jgi:glycosyltransferase involved in cell wall biosynthesis
MGLTQGLRGFATRLLLHYFRMWDLRSAVGVDAFISNSSYVAAQVKKLYRRDCTVLYPPIDLSRFRLETVKEDYYVTASRLVPYKRIDMIVNAFRQMPNRRLIVIGDGPERLRIGRAAKDQANIQILGYQSDDQLTHYVGKAKAFVFAAVEDFGIAPLEAQASGTPVIALGRGGVCETIRPLGVTDPTGVLYPLQTEASLIVAIELFEASASHITPEACRQNAERFSADRFQAGLCALIHSARSDRGLIEVDAAQASGEVSGRRFYADSSEADTRDLLATDRRAANHNFNGTAD